MTTSKKLAVGLLAAILAAAATTAIIILKRKRTMDKQDTSRPLNPVSGRITSPFGPRKAPTAGASTFHNGVDIACPVGTPVRAPWDGTVVRSWTDSTYGGGLSLRVSHPNGYTTGYAHLSQVLVVPGQQVTQGDVLALSGNTGRTTGPHLHLTLRRTSDNQAVDPLTLFDL